jgi:hypothetical protein
MDKTEVRSPVKQSKQGRRAERKLQNQLKLQEQKRAARNRRFTIIGSVIAVVLIIAGFSIYSLVNANRKANTSGAPSVDTSSSVAPVVDNIACEVNEQTVYHIHAHLSLYINGQKQALTPNIGINEQQGCYYWLHTHDNSGVIHIESPQQVIYTLGNFFHIWSQQFSQLQYPIELNVQSGWQVYVDGKPYKGDFNAIPLNAHTLVTMAYNSPGIPIDTVYNWNGL